MTGPIVRNPLCLREMPPESRQHTRNSTEEKTSTLSAIIKEIECFFTKDPKIITCSITFAAGLVIAGAFTGGIGAICLYALAGLAGIIPPVTVHAARHSNENHHYFD